MKVKVDPDLCIGCSLCEQICSDFFSMEGDKAVAQDGEVPGNLQEKVKEAAGSCPVDAIVVS